MLTLFMNQPSGSALAPEDRIIGSFVKFSINEELSVLYAQDIEVAIGNHHHTVINRHHVVDEVQIAVLVREHVAMLLNKSSHKISRDVHVVENLHLYTPCRNAA